jgi:hypothetical protein
VAGWLPAETSLQQAAAALLEAASGCGKVQADGGSSGGMQQQLAAERVRFAWRGTTRPA